MIRITGTWRNATKQKPCPICGGTDWCAISADDSCVACRRKEGGISKIDKGGNEYHLYRLNNNDSFNDPIPEMLTDSPQSPPDLVILDKVYRSLLGGLKLSENHMENLLRRGLSLEEIQFRGYKTLPLRGRSKLAKKLVNKFGREICVAVPGIYLKKDIEQDNQYWSIACPPGLLIPVLNLQRQIVAFKIRHDETAGDSRYRYFSSKKYDGLGPGAHVHFPLFEGTFDVVRMTEGELKADVSTVLSRIFTLSIPGVGAWRKGVEALKGLGAKTVKLAFDMDARHNITVARALKNTMKALIEEGFNVELEIWNEVDGKGIDDLYASGKAPEVITGDDALNAVEEILKTAEALNPTSPKKGDSGKPAIDAGCQDLQVVTVQTIEALKTANASDPRLFLHGGPVRIEPDDFGYPVTRELTVDRLRNVLGQVVFWYKVNDEGEQRPAKPPNDVVRNILATPGLPFPALMSITQAPTFGPDGNLEIAPGYHKGSKTYYAPAPGFSVPTIPACPTPDDVNKAKKLILDDLLHDFPFTDQADRAHAVGLLELLFVRPMIKGPTPLHIGEAPAQGSGKGLMIEVLLYPALGQSIGVIPPPRDDEELRKSITSRLKEGRSAVLLDNVHSLKSAVLAAALTAPIWSDRVLGKNETLNMPIRWVWTATGNNATVDTDIARRSVRIRLTPMTDKPWLRDGFKHSDLRSWVADHRGELVWAALTLAQSWIAAGRPPAKVKPLGSYENWTTVIGGILEHAGIEGFLSNALQFYEASDIEGAVWRQFVAAWRDRFSSQSVKASDLFPLAVKIDGFDLGKGSTERAQKTAFGMKLARQKDRIFDEYRIEAAGTDHQAQLWRLNRGGNLGNLGNLLYPVANFTANNTNNEEKNIHEYEKVSEGSPGSPLCIDAHENHGDGAVPAFEVLPEGVEPENWEEDKRW